MRKFIAFTVLFALTSITPILNTSGRTSASSTQVSDGGSASSMYKRICKGDTIPTGWVITALWANSTNCPGTESYREYTIKDVSSFPVYSGQLVCQNSPVPKRWKVIDKRSIGTECPEVGSMVILRTR